MKEDSHSLIGFDNEQERKLFRQLIRITGVCPKMALTILSGIDEQQYAVCIANDDVAIWNRRLPRRFPACCPGAGRHNSCYTPAKNSGINQA